MTPEAFATASGVRITNTVTVNFSVGGVSQDEGSAVTGFVVDRKIDMQVIDNGPITNGRPKQTDRELIYQVINEGNDAQDFDIDVDLTGDLAGDFTLDTTTGTLDPSKYRVYISTDNVRDGSDTVYDPTGFSTAASPLAFDAGATTDTFYVIILLNIPSDAQDDETVTFSVRATALNATEDGALTETLNQGLDNEGDPSAAVDIVFADGPGTAGSNGTDIAEDGKHTDNTFVQVSSAALTVTKAVTIVSENTQGDFTCTTDADPAIDDLTQGAIPGACLEYTITVSNGSGASENATGISISDTLQSGITFSAFVSPTDWTTPAESSGTITATLTDPLAPGETADLVYRVTVD